MSLNSHATRHMSASGKRISGPPKSPRTIFLTPSRGFLEVSSPLSSAGAEPLVAGGGPGCLAAHGVDRGAGGACCLWLFLQEVREPTRQAAAGDPQLRTQGPRGKASRRSHNWAHNPELCARFHSAQATCRRSLQRQDLAARKTAVTGAHGGYLAA